VRQPLDEWLAQERFGVYSRSVCEQALYLAAELSFERAAEVLRHVGDVAMSGRQIERVLRAEAAGIAAALGVEPPVVTALFPSASLGALDGAPPVRLPGAAALLPPAVMADEDETREAVSPPDLMPFVPAERFRRQSAGASLVARLRQLKAAGRWNANWSKLEVQASDRGDGEPPSGPPTGSSTPPPSRDS
jgi:hypothetical protein